MKETLRDYVQQLLLTPSSTPLQTDDDLLGGGMIDSLGLMNMIAFIEETYGLTVPPEDMVIEHFMSIDTIAAYLESRKVASN